MNVTLIVLQMYENYFLVEGSILYTLSYDFKFTKIKKIKEIKTQLRKVKHLSK